MGGRWCPHSLSQVGVALTRPLSQTHLALGSILTHFGTVGLGELGGIVVLIQNFDVHLHNGFFACGGPCREKGLITTVGSARARPRSRRCVDGHSWRDAHFAGRGGYGLGREARDGTLDEKCGRGRGLSFRYKDAY